MQIHNFFPGADNRCKAHFVFDRYGVSFGNFYQKYLTQNLINIQLIIWKAKRVHEYAFFYALYTE
jgi:hypothetical protein